MSEFRRRLIAAVSQNESDIPAGCVRCEYLESTGTQWIDTEYTPTRGDELEIDRYIVTQNTAAPTLFGAGDGTSQFVAVHNHGGLFVRYFSNIAKSVNNIDYTRFHSLLVNQNGDIYVDDSFRETSSPLYNDVNTTLAIFNRGSRAASFIGCIGTVTITRDNVRVLHLIPCLDANTTPCYYDAVNKKFHYNKGTGEFLYKILEQ
jgi:hypothetical protein